MKKLLPLFIYSLMIMNAQRFNNNLNANFNKINAHLTTVQEDAKGKAGVS